MSTTTEKRSIVVRQEIDGDVLVLSIDNPPANASSQAVRAGLMAGLERLNSQEGLVAAVLIGAGDSFMAGSDINEFDGPVPEPELPEVIAAIEASPQPVVAAIDGFALGGGLEIALGCDIRIATPRAQLGLPEVNLGIVPGSGGTQRLPRLVGRSAAMDLIVTGRRVGAREAMALGIVDQIVENQLRFTAVALARTASKRPVAQLRIPAEAPDAVDRAEATALRAGGMSAARIEAARLVRDTGKRPFGETLADERLRFHHLRCSPEATALRHLFFAERAAPRRAGIRPSQERVTHAGIIGAGAMGMGIAVSLALHGTAVHLFDKDPEQAHQALVAAREQLARVAKRHNIDPKIADRHAHGITASPDLSDLAEAQLIVEAVFEDPEVKVSVLRAAQAAAPGAVLATNTSYLGVDRLAASMEDPSALIGMHFFNPAHVMRLVEVVPGANSSPDAIALGLRAVRDMDKQAVVAGDEEGFIGNRIFAVYRRHAEYLLEDGALPHEVDRALESFGFAMGPFAVADLSGLQIAQALRQRWRKTGRVPRRYVDIPDILCERGRYGRRSAAGYYSYMDDGQRTIDDAVAELVVTESKRKGIVRRRLGKDIILGRTIGAMVIEGARAVVDGIAAHPDDIDVVMVNGFGFPRSQGGPMWWARQQNPSHLDAILGMVTEAAQEEIDIQLVRQVLAQE